MAAPFPSNSITHSFTFLTRHLPSHEVPFALDLLILGCRPQRIWSMAGQMSTQWLQAVLRGQSTVSRMSSRMGYSALKRLNHPCDLGSFDPEFCFLCKALATLRTIISPSTGLEPYCFGPNAGLRHSNMSAAFAGCLLFGGAQAFGKPTSLMVAILLLRYPSHLHTNVGVDDHCCYLSWQVFSRAGRAMGSIEAIAKRCYPTFDWTWKLWDGKVGMYW